MTQIIASKESFDKFVLTELEIVRSGEERLERLFTKLRFNPQLEDCFRRELETVRKRADRLDAILNGREAVQLQTPVCDQLPAA